MHPMVARNPRLRKLYELDRQIGDRILGSSKPERGKLIRLRKRIQDEIRSIDMWEPIREKMREQQQSEREEES